MFIKALQRSRAGFTLIEVMVSTAIGSLVIGLIMGVSFYTGRSIASLTDSVALSNDSREVIDRMSQKIRQAIAVTAYATNSITVTYMGTNLTYAFVEDDGTLIEVENTTTNVLLEDCTSLRFDLYRRNPITNSFDQFPAADTLAEAKLVRVSWTCESQAVGKGSGSSELVSSKIVLRSK